MPQWALMVFHSKLWELSLMACFARWTFNVNASEAAPWASINDYSTACYARAVQNIDEH